MRSTFPARQIDDPEAVVAEFGNKQPLALYIDAEVIDPAAHIAERDLCFEHEGCCRRLRQSYDRRQQGLLPAAIARANMFSSWRC